MVIIKESLPLVPIEKYHLALLTAKFGISTRNSFDSSIDNVLYLSCHIQAMASTFLFHGVQARFACLRCATGGHFVSAGGALRAPVVTLINFKVDNNSKYVCPTVIIDIARKITKFVSFFNQFVTDIRIYIYR